MDGLHASINVVFENIVIDVKRSYLQLNLFGF